MDDSPWICCGDFNEILDKSEKFGGRQKMQLGIDNFRRTIDICHLHDLGFEGDDCFTWSNGSVFERLDRFFGKILVGLRLF